MLMGEELVFCVSGDRCSRRTDNSLKIIVFLFLLKVVMCSSYHV